MPKQAYYQIFVGGQDISLRVAPYLISLNISDKEGTHSDTCSLTLDDKDGQLLLPNDGDEMVVFLGWENEGAAVAFKGTVDEVKSSGSRGSGRQLKVSAKGVDTKSKAKQPQHKHMDNKDPEAALNEAGKLAGISVKVDPAFKGMTREWGG